MEAEEASKIFMLNRTMMLWPAQGNLIEIFLSAGQLYAVDILC
jgi:hypothetical protein